MRGEARRAQHPLHRVGLEAGERKRKRLKLSERRPHRRIQAENILKKRTYETYEGVLEAAVDGPLGRWACFGSHLPAPAFISAAKPSAMRRALLRGREDAAGCRAGVARRTPLAETPFFLARKLRRHLGDLEEVLREATVRQTARVFPSLGERRSCRSARRTLLDSSLV